MPSVSAAIAESARKNERIVLQSLATVSQTKVAELLGVSDSTVTRLKEGTLEQLCALLAACGLKVVPAEMRCFAPDKVQALLTLARAHLTQIQKPEELEWE